LNFHKYYVVPPNTSKPVPNTGQLLKTSDVAPTNNAPAGPSVTTTVHNYCVSRVDELMNGQRSVGTAHHSTTSATVTSSDSADVQGNDTDNSNNKNNPLITQLLPEGQSINVQTPSRLSASSGPSHHIDSGNTNTEWRPTCTLDDEGRPVSKQIRRAMQGEMARKLYVMPLLPPSSTTLGTFKRLLLDRLRLMRVAGKFCQDSSFGMSDVMNEELKKSLCQQSQARRQATKVAYRLHSQRKTNVEQKLRRPFGVRKNSRETLLVVPNGLQKQNARHTSESSSASHLNSLTSVDCRQQISAPSASGYADKSAPSDSGDARKSAPSASVDVHTSTPSATGDADKYAPSASGDTDKSSPSVTGDAGKSAPFASEDAHTSTPSATVDADKSAPSASGDADISSPSATGDADKCTPSASGDSHTSTPSTTVDAEMSAPSASGDTNKLLSSSGGNKKHIDITTKEFSFAPPLVRWRKPRQSKLLIPSLTDALVADADCEAEASATATAASFAATMANEPPRAGHVPATINPNDKNVQAIAYKLKVKADSLMSSYRNTHDYQMLKARFMSLFVWPALLSTVPVNERTQSPLNNVPTESVVRLINVAKSTRSEIPSSYVEPMNDEYRYVSFLVV